MLGRVVDGGAGRDHSQRLELCHQLPTLLLQPVQQVEAVGAQGAVVDVGLVQDEKRQVGQEAAHVVLGVLNLPEVVAQRPSAVEGLRVGHQPLLDHVGGHQGQAGALQDLPALGEVTDVAIDPVDAGGVHARSLRHVPRRKSSSCLSVVSVRTATSSRYSSLSPARTDINSSFPDATTPA